MQSRAQAAVKAIGALEVTKAIQGKAPWRSLKFLASNSNFRLVHPDELQRHIAKKAGDEIEKPGKKTRANRPSQQHKGDSQIQIDPTKLQIPPGTFVSQDQPIGQILPSQIGPIAEGVVVVTLAQAEPYLKANQIVSNGPLALLIVSCPISCGATTLGCTQVTVPVRCVINQEPLLLEATLVQIGTGLIEKKVTAAAPAIETASVATLKAVVYKDEVALSWDQFVAGPVKYILSQIPILRLCTEPSCSCDAWHNDEKVQVAAAIVDVWRRQFLRQGFRPEPPSTASIYSVCIRVPSCIGEKVLAASGQGGVYFEPRTPDAKDIDRSYDVVWIPRADKGSAMHLRQTNPISCGLARSGDRWGLRVRSDQAHKVHQSVRPDAVFLEQGPRLHFSISPIPYGTDRQALCRALKAAQWEAKPIQPIGSVEGNRGNTWTVVSTKQPPSNIIEMSHGEVVISKLRAPENARKEVMQPVAASSTLSLCGGGPISIPSRGKDPWVIQDPWQQYNVSKAAGGVVATPDASAGLKQLESKIEQAVLAKLPTQPVSMEQDDVPDRVATLERQVNSLMSKHQQMEANMNEHHVHQAAQLTQLQGQINAQGQQFAGQLDSQQQHIKSMFDSQMAQIRTLLAKRPREDGE